MLPLRRVFRRAFRWAWNALAVLSLLLCVGAAVEWCRSYRGTDLVTWIDRGPERGVIGTEPGAAVYSTERSWVAPGQVGTIRLSHYASPGVLSNGIARYETWLGFGYAPPVLGIDLDEGPFYRVPFWSLVAVTTLAPAAWAWKRRHRSVGLGRCPSCSYDLTGNESGVCPECGKPLATAGVRGGG